MARRPPTTELDALISQYQHESQRPRADEALFMLRKIGSIVKPIMRQRGWRVGILAEFYPSQTNLLGLNTNHGEKINLRLRHAGDATQFLRFEDIVDTMLHELCHNVIGPHNQQFHALWDQLRDEHEALVRKGYTGEGFLGRGQTLSGGRRLPLHEAQRLARQAAERRRQLNAGSGQRLGGTGILRGQDARAVIADAVERRLRIERGCASGTAAGEQVVRDEEGKQTAVTTTQAGPDDENETTMMQAYIDLIQEEEREKFGGHYSPVTADNPAGSRGQGLQPESSKAHNLVRQQKEIEAELARAKQSIKPTKTADTAPRARQPSPASSRPSSLRTTTTPSSSRRPVAESQPVRSSPQPPTDLDMWTCEICTLINPLSFLTCDACGVERPASVSLLYDQQKNSAGVTKQPPTKKAKETPNALKPRLNAYDSIKRFEQERVKKVEDKPVGWRCRGCSNFMEAEWWTCAGCGRMKESS